MLNLLLMLLFLFCGKKLWNCCVGKLESSFSTVLSFFAGYLGPDSKIVITVYRKTVCVCVCALLSPVMWLLA